MILTSVPRSVQNQNQIDLGFNETTFGFSIILALITFGQLIFVAWCGFSWNRGHGPAKDESESEKLFRYRRTFTILMVLTLVVLILSYSFDAASFAPKYKEFVVWNNLAKVLRDLATVLLFAGLSVLLFYCRLAAEQWRAGGFAHAPSFNRPDVVFQFVLLFVMTATTICRIVFAIVPPIEVPLAKLIVYQVYMVAYVIFVISFVVLATQAWKRRDISSFQLLESSSRRAAFDPNETLFYIVCQLSPLLCVWAAYNVARDVVSYLYGASDTFRRFILINLPVQGVAFFIVIFVASRLGEKTYPQTGVVLTA